MRTLVAQVLSATTLLLIFVSSVSAQTPANEHNCPSTTAIPPYVGSGSNMFSPNQNLCMPQLGPPLLPV